MAEIESLKKSLCCLKDDFLKMSTNKSKSLNVLSKRLELIEIDIDYSKISEKELGDVRSAIQILSNLELFYATLHDFSRSIKTNNFDEMHKISHALRDVLLQLANIDATTIKLKNRYLKMQSLYTEKLYLELDSYTPFSNGFSGKTLSFEEALKIYVDFRHSNHLKTLLRNMLDLEILKGYLNTFSSKLFTNLFQPLIRYPNLGIDSKTFRDNTKARNDIKTYRIRLVQNNDLAPDAIIMDKPGQINDLILYLSRTILGINLIENENVCALHMIGELIGKSILNELKMYCFKNNIPKSIDDLTAFQNESDDLVYFEHFLIDWHFLSENNRFISEYREKITFDYISNQMVLMCEKAKELANASLSEYIKVESKFDCFEVLQDQIINLNINEVRTTIAKLKDDALFPNQTRFPECCISQSAKDFLNICLKEIDATADVRKDFLNVPLYVSVRQMVQVYLNVSLQKNVTNSPQSVAILHNNLLYIAHNLNTLGLYLRHLQKNELEKMFSIKSMSFIDMIPNYLSSASNILNELIEIHKERISKIFKDSAACYFQIKESFVKIEQSLHDALEIIKQLSLIFSPILSHDVLNSSISSLLQHLLSTFTACLIACHSFCPRSRLYISSFISLIRDDIPQLIPNQKLHANQQFSKAINNLNSLDLIVSANLNKIRAYWKSGRGDLSQFFTSEQLIAFMSAVLENSYDRDVLLELIN